MAQAALRRVVRNAPDETIDWKRVAYLVQLSRALDEMEEMRLVPEKKVLYQFSARGHDMAQILLGCRLTERHDGACGYYRSRPLLLALGVDPAEALASAMGRTGGYSDGRDIGVVFNYPNRHGASALPMCGGVGSQYTPTAGWAQAIEYYRTVLKQPDYDLAIAVVLGGDGSVASNGFWSALTIATTQSPADAVLYRGQRLRHLRSLDPADPGRQHRRQSLRLAEPRRSSTATAATPPRPRG